MPKIAEILGFILFFWSNEGSPIEPVHVHIAHKPNKNATKFWIYSDGSAILESNGSNLSEKELKRAKKVIEQYSNEIVLFWEDYFGVTAIYKNEM